MTTSKCHDSTTCLIITIFLLIICLSCAISLFSRFIGKILTFLKEWVSIVLFLCAAELSFFYDSMLVGTDLFPSVASVVPHLSLGKDKCIPLFVP